jgi:hypothetical protein
MLKETHLFPESWLLEKYSFTCLCFEMRRIRLGEEELIEWGV